jgi:hypothetical protein
MEDLDNFLLEAIETDSLKEYTVPLNEDGKFINKHFSEDPIKKANINVTVKEHYYDTSEEVDLEACNDWLIEFHCGNEVMSKDVSINETASFSFLQEDIIGEDGVDDILAIGVDFFELSIIAKDPRHPFTTIKIEVS